MDIEISKQTENEPNSKPAQTANPTAKDQLNTAQCSKDVPADAPQNNQINAEGVPAPKNATGQEPETEKNSTKQNDKQTEKNPDKGRTKLRDKIKEKNRKQSQSSDSEDSDSSRHRKSHKHRYSRHSKHKRDDRKGKARSSSSSSSDDSSHRKKKQSKKDSHKNGDTGIEQPATSEVAAPKTEAGQLRKSPIIG